MDVRELCSGTDGHCRGTDFYKVTSEGFGMKPIVVVGSINMDLVSIADRIPFPGETVLGNEFQLHSGGKGANQAVAVAKLAYPSILLGKIGSDAFGTELLETLAKYGVDTDEIERVDGSSGTASIVVNLEGENSIVVTPGANLQVTPDYLESKRHVLRGAGMILAQLEIPIDTIRRLAEIAEEFQVPLMLDPAPAHILDAATLSGITWFTPNESETLFYVKSKDASEEILKQLFEAGIRNVILKRGSEGALIASANGTRHWVEAFSVNAIDTTAAGDAFNGAFAVAWMLRKSVEECAYYAAAAAALSVTRRGAQPSLPSEKELHDFLSSHQSNQETEASSVR
jgi:ribokinase